MIYALKDLLMKMGAPEAAEKTKVEWFYFDKELKDLAGFAGLRFETGGEQLIAEMKHIRENFEDDNGAFHENYTEYFHMTAERTARPGHYRVTSIAYDGTHYDKPSAAVIELGLGVFHARALDISLAMIEQSFSKEDMLQKHDETKGLCRTFMGQAAAEPAPKITARRFGTRKFAPQKGKKPTKTVVEVTPTTPTAIILPFRPRAAIARAS